MDDDTRYCTTCGRPIAATETRCVHCGAAQPTDAASAAAPGGPGQGAERERGFLAALVDARFEAFVTPKVIRVLYVLAIVAIGLVYVVGTIAGFQQDTGTGVLVLLLGPFVGLLYLTLVRMSFEFLIAQFTIAENTRRTAALLEREAHRRS